MTVKNMAALYRRIAHPVEPAALTCPESYLETTVGVLPCSTR